MSRTRAATLLVLAGVTFGMTLGGSAAADDPKKEAQGLFTQGVRLSESGDLSGALLAFRAAYEKSPNYRVLYNIGKLCGKLQDPACAVRAFEQYLREGGEIPPKRKAEVESELQTAKSQTGTLAITAAEGAGVTVDDLPVGRAPLAAPVPANPGPHKVVISIDGKTAERTVTAAAGETTPVDVVIPKDPPPAADVPPDEPTPPPKPEKKKSTVAPWLVTGGLAAATVVSGVIAAVTYSSFVDKRAEFPVTRDELDSAQGTARTFFLLTGIFGALTVVSAGVAGYFTLHNASASTTANAVLPHGRFLLSVSRSSRDGGHR